MGEKRSFQISSLMNDRVFEIVIKGEMKRYDLKWLRTEVVNIIKESAGDALLVDVRENRKFDVTFGEAYFV